VVAIAFTAVAILWYNVTGTADAQQRLAGQPFDNATRIYSGSSDDAALNAGVARFSADPAALAAMNAFETAGNLRVPVVTLHTTGDPIVPYEQQRLYAAKVGRSGATARLTQIPVERYGHCNFESSELVGAFTSLIDRVTRPLAVHASR
jgi:dienelactone hydrolase